MTHPVRARPAPLVFSRVQHTAERVAIIASGPSLAGVDLTMPPGVDVIAVNAAILHLPAPPRFWFTLDPSPTNRAIMATAARWPDTEFYAAVYNSHRVRAGERAHLLKRIHGQGPKSGKAGLSTLPTGIHAGNSAYGALGLAFLLGAKRIALFGVDGTHGYAWGKGTPRDLKHMPWLFGTAVKQLAAAGVQVVNGSPDSAVECWPRMTPEEAVQWLRE